MNLGNYNNVFYKSRRRINKSLNGGNYAVYLNEFKSTSSTRNTSPNQASFKANNNIANLKLPSDLSSTNGYMIYPKSLQISPNSQQNKNSIYQSPYKFIPKKKKDDFDIQEQINTTSNSESKYQKRYFKSALDNYDNIPTRRDQNRMNYEDQKQAILLPSIIKEREQNGYKNYEINLDPESENQINIKDRVDASYEFFQKIIREVRKNSEFKKELEEEFHRTSNSKKRNRTIDNYEKDLDDNMYLRGSKQKEYSLSGIKSVRYSKDSIDESLKKPDSKLNSLRVSKYKYQQTRLNKTEMTEIDDFEQDQEYQKQVNFTNQPKSYRNENKLNSIDQDIISLNNNNYILFGLESNKKYRQNKYSSPLNKDSQQIYQIRNKDEISEVYKKLIQNKRSVNLPSNSLKSPSQLSPLKASYDKKKKNSIDDFEDNQINEITNDRNNSEILNGKVFKNDLVRRYKEILGHNNLTKDELSETKQKAFDLTHTYYSQKLSLLEKQLRRKKTENELLENRFDETLTNYKLQTATEQSKIKQSRHSKQLGTLSNESRNQSSEQNNLNNQDNTVLCQEDEDLKMEVCMKCNSKDIVQQVEEGKEIKLECQIEIKSTDLSQLRRRSSNMIDIIFVIDNVDKLMNNKYWQILEFIKAMLRELDDKDQVCLLVQNNLSEDFEQLQELNTENRKLFLKILEKIPTVPQSSIYSLLLHAYKITQQKENKCRFSHIFAFGDCQSISVYQKVNQNLKNQLSSHPFKTTQRNIQNVSFLNSQQIYYNQIEETSTISKYFCLEPIKNVSSLTLTDDIFDFCNTQDQLNTQKNINNLQGQTQTNSNTINQQNNLTNNQNVQTTVNTNQLNNNTNSPNKNQNNNSTIKNNIQLNNSQNNQVSNTTNQSQNSPQKAQNQINSSDQQNKDQCQQLAQKNQPLAQQNEGPNNQKIKQDLRDNKNNLSDIMEKNEEENLHSSRQTFYRNPENKEKLTQINSLCKQILQQTLNVIQADQLLELRINPIFCDVFKITQIFNEKYTQDEENNVFIFKSKIIDKSKIKRINFEVEAQRQLLGQIISNSQSNIFDEHSIVQSIYAIHDEQVSIKTELYLKLNDQQTNIQLQQNQNK